MGLAEDWGIKAIAFDIDGTLYPKRALDTRLALTSALHLPFALRYNAMRRAMRREDGLGGRSPSSLRSFQEREAELMYPGRHRAQWFIRKEEKVFRKPWERLFLSIKGFEGMKEALQEASGRYTLCALSDFPIGVKLRALGVEEYFSFMASSEDYGSLKPSATPFLAMLSAISLSAEQVLYVGDSESKDIAGAKGVGMRAALISPARSKVYSKADLVFSSWNEFRERVL